MTPSGTGQSVLTGLMYFPPGNIKKAFGLQKLCLSFIDIQNNLNGNLIIYYCFYPVRITVCVLHVHIQYNAFDNLHKPLNGFIYNPI